MLFFQDTPGSSECWLKTWMTQTQRKSHKGYTHRIAYVSFLGIQLGKKAAEKIKSPWKKPSRKVAAATYSLAKTARRPHTLWLRQPGGHILFG